MFFFVLIKKKWFKEIVLDCFFFSFNFVFFVNKSYTLQAKNPLVSGRDNLLKTFTICM